MSEVKLTQYSHGAGCGCKISPRVLDAILAGSGTSVPDPRLLVGNAERDDAAVYDLEDGTAIISTTDFFMPIVDDPFDFGRIAAVNALSDIYAMGGVPLLAISILGWPVELLSPEVAGRVLAGARAACSEAGIPLAGGHSIDSPEPVFGLAVTGRVHHEGLKRNGGARPGDHLFLTKPLGIGILTTAEKKKHLRPEHHHLARDLMVELNRVGTELGNRSWVHAMTDVTGFGLLGHLAEMCDASGLSVRLSFDRVPRIAPSILDSYLDLGCVPGGTGRNWESYGDRIGPLEERQKEVLCDPQTSGGLLLAVDPAHAEELKALVPREPPLTPFGTFVPREKTLVSLG